MDDIRLTELIKAARDQGVQLTTAESCTGGLVSAALTSVPGASDIFERGFVTYSNAAKTDLLGVSPATLARVGAVSEEVAVEMASGAKARAGAGIAVSVTGIAGPGGSEFKPEGRVCFALADASGVRSETVDFGPLGRAAVRAAACDHALGLMARALGV